MAKLVILITARLEQVHAIGEAWKEAGAPGVTFLEGFGLGRLHEISKSTEILSGMLSLFDTLRDSEQTSMVILSLIEKDQQIGAMQKATEAILGDLYTPGSGVFFVIPVEHAVGLSDLNSDPEP